MTQYDDISKLPPRYQEQVRRKLAEKRSPPKEKPERKDLPADRTARKSKYGNRKTEADGILFDSKKEAKRFLELREMERAGEIFDLRLQVNFTLIEGYTKPNGERVKPEIYRADFTYFRRDKTGGRSIYIVEDVKTRGTRTEAYKIKRKQLYEKFHLEIKEL